MYETTGMRVVGGLSNIPAANPLVSTVCNLNAADKIVDPAISGQSRSRATAPPRRRGIQSVPFYMNPARDTTRGNSRS